MKTLKLSILFLLTLVFVNVNAQEKKKYKIHTVAFYNLENLFDTINDPLKYKSVNSISNDDKHGNALSKEDETLVTGLESTVGKSFRESLRNLCFP